MRRSLLSRWLWLALCLLSPLAGALPTLAQTGRATSGRPTSERPTSERPVSEWIALANAQLARGRPGQALVLFGAIEQRYPGLAPVRQGLRRSFARIGGVHRSEAFLRYAITEDPARAGALMAAWQALDRMRPLRFSASVSLLPSSNVEHVASERFLVTDFGTFLITDGGEETPGVGLGVNLAVDWVLHPRPGHRFRLRAGYAAAWFDDAKLRYGAPSLALKYDHLGGRAPWSLEAYLRARSYGGAAADVTADNVARGLVFAKAWRPGRNDRLLLRLAGEYRRYSEEDYLTGPRYSLDLERRTPLGRKGRLSYGIRVERALPRVAYHRYTGVELRLGYQRPIFDGLRGGVSLSLGEQRYDGTFPILGFARRDRTVSLGLSAELTRVRILGQAPTLTCAVRRTQSNIALYTTNSVDCAMALKLDF